MTRDWRASPARWAGVAWRVAMGALLPACVALCGCESEPRATELVQPRATKPPAAPGERLTRVERLDVFAGRAMVLPLDRGPGGPVRVELDNGRPLESRAYQVKVRVPADPSLAGGDPWVPAPGVWSSEGSGDDPWVLVVELPQDAAGRDIVIDGTRFATHWLPGVDSLPRAEARAQDPWRPARPAKAPADLATSPRVFPESQSPITRWRWRLVADGLRPDAAAAPFADAVIEQLARQNEDRWRVALAWLWASNTDVASRLKVGLAAVIDFGDGVYAPAWPTNHALLDHLLEGLLDPSIGPSRRAAIAEQWLREQASAVAWIIDDGGTLDQPRRVVLPTLGVANLLSRPVLGWSALGAPGAATQPGAEALRPIGGLGQISSVVTPATPEALAALQNAGVGEVTASVGEWSVRFPVASVARPVLPPGQRVGPCWADQTMEDWLSGRVSPARGGVMTAGLVQMSPRVMREDGRVTPERWEVVLECREPEAGEGSREESRDEVRVYFGPFGQPTAVVRVTASGRAEMLRGGAGAGVECDFGRDGDVWRCRLTLPAGAVEGDGVVRMGLERVDRYGRRSAWPRPMLPWQNEPGRAALDTRGWRGKPE